MTSQPRPRPHQSGAALEELLTWQHNIYQANRRALVWHSGTKGEVHQDKVILVKSRPDYEGVLTCLSGRHISFDAKHSAFPVYHHDRRRIHQLQYLWEVHEAGGLAFLLISYQLERYFIIGPEPAWATLKPLTVKLLELGSRGVEVPVAGSYSLPDWLSILEELRA